MSADLPGRPLRIAVLGDFEGLHTRRWLRVFVERGHDVHAISYYRPQAELPGVKLHFLSRASSSASTGPNAAKPRLGSSLPRSLLRLVHAYRYRRAGLKRLLQEIEPDVFHAHYAVEHAFYGTFAGFHPYVVSAWGSDLYVDSFQLAGRLIAAWSLRRADLVTANDAALARRAVELGAPAGKVTVVRLGADRLFLDGPSSINLAPDSSGPPTVISDRALEPLYNIDVVVRAFARVRDRLTDARLVVVHDGSQRRRLEALTTGLGLDDSVSLAGRIEPIALRNALAAAHVYVSVPASDSFAVSTLEAMAAGSFPVISDLPSADGMIADAVNGLRVPAGDVDALADALSRALTDPELRRRAAVENRRRVETEGLTDANMLQMERHYYRLAGLIAPAAQERQRST